MQWEARVISKFQSSDSEFQSLIFWLEGDVKCSAIWNCQFLTFKKFSHHEMFQADVSKRRSWVKNKAIARCSILIDSIWFKTFVSSVKCLHFESSNQTTSCYHPTSPSWRLQLERRNQLKNQEPFVHSSSEKPAFEVELRKTYITINRRMTAGRAPDLEVLI